MTAHLHKWVFAVVCMISAWLISDMEIYAQAPSSDNSVVEGVVSDQSGAPLAGVAALVQGNTSVFAITDADGMYRLEGVTLGSVIEFSCLGMIPVTVTWNGERRLDVTMEEESLELEATVVIGYGSVKKKDLTGSVGILDGESLQASSTTLLSQRLQGMIPGLNVSRTGSMPGTSATLQIRGVTTMSDNSPLILIDGMPASSIDDVNSLDIDQITVLKDAASASIYGARAAAGVILITTKSASEGETVINYSGEVSFHTLSELPESVGALDYMRMYNEMQWNDAGNPAGGEYNTYTQDFIDNYYMNHEIDPITYPLTDWKDLMLKDFALRHKHSLVLTYGNKVVIPEDALLFEFKRRFVEYKRPWMPFEDINQLKQILLDNNAHYIMAGMIAGNVSRSDSTYRRLESMLQRIADDPVLRERVHYITDYDENLARAMSFGADISINVPIVGLEACGTSFMKDVANLTVLVATNDGGVADATPPVALLVEGDEYPEEIASLYDRMRLAAAICRNNDRWSDTTATILSGYLSTICGTRMMRDYLRFLFKPVE